MGVGSGMRMAGGARARQILRRLPACRQAWCRWRPRPGLPVRVPFPVRPQTASDLADAPRLLVERQWDAALRVEHDDADRRGLDQRLQVGAGAPLVAVRACIGDGDGRLGGEQHQHLLVLVGECLFALLPAREEVPDFRAAMAHRRALEGSARDEPRREPERLDVRSEVGHSKRRIETAQVLEQLHCVGRLPAGRLRLPGLPGRPARYDMARGRPASSMVAIRP